MWMWHYQKTGQFIPAHALKKIYLSIAYPCMMYGVELWGKSSATQLAKLSRLQNKCIRMIYPNQSVFLSCQLYHLLSFENIYTYYVLIKFYQYYITKRSIFFNDKICMQKRNHDYGTRFSSNYNINLPAARLATCQCSFLFQGISMWNHLPLEIKQSCNTNIFKRKLRLSSLMM